MTLSRVHDKIQASEMERVLGGRYVSKMIMPFSFAEVLDYKKISRDKASMLTSSKVSRIRKACQEYLSSGGLPEALLLLNKREYIKSVYEKVLLGDIVEREQVNNKMALRLMVKKIAETVMHEVSFNTLASNIKATGVKTSTDSMIDYTSYAENSYLFFRTRNFVSKFAEREGIPRFYFIDNGILSLFLVDKKSALLENAVAVHLRRRYFDEIYYFRSSQTGIDIDFYLPEENMAVQVAYELGDAKESETRSLVRFAKKTKGVSRLFIVTYEEEKTIETDDCIIQVVPLHKFLLLK